MSSRVGRHSIFWLVWVLSFTFIKSFGASFSTYFAWFIYYIFTLPVFIAHTYILVYWVFRRFNKGWNIVLAVFFFLILLCVFSFIELLITDEILSPIFPQVFTEQQSYKEFASVLVSGVGNLYIVLVFIASRMIREWYMDEEQQQELSEQRLFLERSAVNSSIQPGMLLYAVEQIEKLAKKGSDMTTVSVSVLSEVLNSVMQHSDYEMVPVEEELRLIKKALGLYMVFDDREISLIYQQCADCESNLLPAFMIFSPLEMIRRDDLKNNLHLVSIHHKSETVIELYPENVLKESYLIDKEKMQKGMSELYPGRFLLENVRSKGLDGVRIAVC